MDVTNVMQLFWNTCILLPLLWIIATAENSELSECVDPRQVYLSNLQITNKMYVDGQYCNCKPPIEGNQNNPYSRFSWYHYQRVDWVLHFHFCNPLIPTRKCTPEEQQGIVASIVVDQDKWNPSKDKMECHCGVNNTYYMHSWQMIDAKENKAIGQWKYHFTCDSKLCKPEQACVRHYLNHAASHTTGFVFKCHCLEGSYCPVGIGDKKLQSFGVDKKDEIGPYMESFCTPLPGWKKPAKEVNGGD